MIKSDISIELNWIYVYEPKLFNQHEKDLEFVSMKQ